MIPENPNDVPAPTFAVETQLARRGHDFYPADTASWPTPDDVGDLRHDAITILAHYFVGGCDWWVAAVDEDGVAYGYADLGLGDGFGEWGYVSLPELEGLRVHGWLVVERDLDWAPTAASAVANISDR